MDIELNPPRGITGVNLGITLEQAIDDLARYGAVTVSRGTPITVGDILMPADTKVLATGTGFEIVAHLEDQAAVSAIEIWGARRERADGLEDNDLHVTYDGIDMFRTPARQILQQLRQRGHTVDEDEPEYAAVPGLTFGFTRVAGHEVPLDTDGLPLYFEAVLVAGAGYYD